MRLERAPVVAASALGGVGLLMATFLATRQLDPRPLPSVRLEGVPVPRDGALATHLDARARHWAGESVTLETGVHLWRPTRAELGARLPVDDAAARVLGIGRSLNPLVALPAWWRGVMGPGHDLPWRPRIDDRAALETYVQRVRAQVDRLPTPGTRGVDGAVVDGLAGEALDVEATERAIAAAIARGRRHIAVATLVTPPIAAVRTFGEPAEVATVLMMRQETEYRASNQSRATNIALAARKLDGAVILPGASFSFNQRVGKRTRAAGFAPALELLNGELVMGIGGGVCQTAGTLHAAAFFAGMTVEEQRPHSRLNQFAYLRPGLDTMVAWPDHVDDLRQTRDLRIRNPYPFPVVVRSAVLPREGGPSTLRIELYGAARPFRVDYSFEEVGAEPSPELIRVDASLAPGETRVQQEALEGLVILRKRVVYTPTRRVEEVVKVRYPPTPRITRVSASAT
ncbi:MAG: VanW family protein [Polyangiales bacterium]